MNRRILICLLSLFSTNGFSLETEPLRKKIFDLYSHKTGCHSIKYTISEGVSKLDPTLDSFIKELLVGIKSGKVSKQIGLFHPRLKISSEAIDSIIASEKTTLGFPFETSVYKVFALNTVDGSPGGLYCSDDEIKIWPQYGYPLQFGIWIQLLGQKELGRVYVTIVPKDGRWWIGAFHYHQWTHKGKDFEKWFYEGQEDLKQNKKYMAFIKFDLSMKLLDGKKEFHLPLTEQVKKYQKEVMERNKFKAKIQEILKDWTLLHVNSILAPDGTGLIIRVQKDKEISGKDMEKDCQTIGEALITSPEFSELNGLRCSYVIKGEPIDKEGFLGGMYVAADKIKEEMKSKKSEKK